MPLVVSEQVAVPPMAAWQLAGTQPRVMLQATQLVQPSRAAMQSRVTTKVAMSTLVSSDAWRSPAMAAPGAISAKTRMAEKAVTRTVSETPRAAEISAATSELRTSTVEVSNPVLRQQSAATTWVAMQLPVKRLAEIPMAVPQQPEPELAETPLQMEALSQVTSWVAATSVEMPATDSQRMRPAVVMLKAVSVEMRPVVTLMAALAETAEPVAIPATV